MAVTIALALAASTRDVQRRPALKRRDVVRGHVDFGALFPPGGWSDPLDRIHDFLVPWIVSTILRHIPSALSHASLEAVVGARLFESLALASTLNRGQSRCRQAQG